MDRETPASDARCSHSSLLREPDADLVDVGGAAAAGLHQHQQVAVGEVDHAELEERAAEERAEVERFTAWVRWRDGAVS